VQVNVEERVARVFGVTTTELNKLALLSTKLAIGFSVVWTLAFLSALI
jgi:hypothetical protein